MNGTVSLHVAGLGTHGRDDHDDGRGSENVGPGRQPVWLADSSERLEKSFGPVERNRLCRIVDIGT
jgi:hypothetical protein